VDRLDSVSSLVDVTRRGSDVVTGHGKKARAVVQLEVAGPVSAIWKRPGN
jgi:hypothetical protein